VNTPVPIMLPMTTAVADHQDTAPRAGAPVGVGEEEVGTGAIEAVDGEGPI
jgi:hypothetical protein